MVFTKVFFRIMGNDLDSSEMTALLLMHPDRFYRKCIRVGNPASLFRPSLVARSAGGHPTPAALAAPRALYQLTGVARSTA